MDRVDTLQEIADETKIVGYSVWADKEEAFATSDIDLAAFLRINSVPCIGTLHRTFHSRGREKKKIYLVFQASQALLEALDRWQGPEGELILQFKAHYKHLMCVINDSKDIDEE